MQLTSIKREAAAFQRPLSAGQIEAICARTLPGGTVLRAEELGLGTFNTTYRLDLDDRSVVLRVAPSPTTAGVEHTIGLRNEYAAAPYLAGLGDLVPSIIAADFTRELVDRDYLVQTLLPGRPAPEVLARFPRARWAVFYRQLGTITRRIHAVRGTSFGPVADPRSATWSAALVEHFASEVHLYREAGLDATAVEVVGGFVAARADLFDAVEPRLLHGDLWHVNLLLDPDAPEPTITGLIDTDRASWGDPWADWTITMARKRPGTERDAFWQGYGAQPSDPDSITRQLVYDARGLIDSRLDIHRRGLDLDEIPRQFWDLAPLVRALTGR
ncbi:aminoglycoside phosphotransferase family protein [Desertihabitans brevis]|uniref:Aminoglycoside phosphotransferase family protein n=1 Tax=Desertihabitans brevis TaxID=2268447 RepID=A0A367YRW6_9ACTN|nr:aminoglycoside phosphotransferase family protein [Desertihabitans brevis]RCK68635.1 aminoglycoside phosphotransferase family protein [Desertihabitans brevis]